ncbi:hypothetical protein [Candidatus Methylobacter oryzae]|uniref:hypothetical protein n=1 Tax=Candidatus Methylobacter oryzae TaxID=2497749 RepID=UPI0012B62920|nr:hypothetical protein [Candidatus Methylobacter oryzae]
MKEQQLITAKGVGKQAMSLASGRCTWIDNANTARILLVLRLTQNGGLKGVGEVD